METISLVVIYTVGKLSYPYDHPASQEFFKVGNELFEEAMNSGQIRRAFPFSPEGFSFPEEALKGKGYPVLTLTVWKDIESLFRFTYNGLHLQALRNRSKWMEPYLNKNLSYCVWWSENKRDVSWKEAYKRYQYYIENGATTFAFDFKRAFDDQGESISLKLN